MDKGRTTLLRERVAAGFAPVSASPHGSPGWVGKQLQAEPALLREIEAPTDRLSDADRPKSQGR